MTHLGKSGAGTRVLTPGVTSSQSAPADHRPSKKTIICGPRGGPENGLKNEGAKKQKSVQKGPPKGTQKTPHPLLGEIFNENDDFLKYSTACRREHEFRPPGGPEMNSFGFQADRKGASKKYQKIKSRKRHESTKKKSPSDPRFGTKNYPKRINVPECE